MRDFIHFLDLYKNLLIFFVLQLLCFSMLLNSSVFQRNVMLSSINHFSGGIHEMRAKSTHFFSLAEENEMLVQENLELINRSRLAYEKVDKDYALINDSLFQRRYTFQYANVISSTKAELKNHISLDKGRTHGLEPRMGVLSNMRLVGKVEMVTENYALVIPVVNIDFVVSARLANSGYFGPLTWEGEDYRFALLKEIPKEASIKVGEPVVTRGAGSLFPAGIRIGLVEKVTLDDEGNFFNVVVKLDVDMSKLNKVMLIKDLHIEELDSLRTDIDQQ